MKTPHAAAVLATRERIVALLSDDEVSKVSTAETAKLSKGDDYIDLEHLELGVAHSTGDRTETGSVLPRKALKGSTWGAVMALLAERSSASDEVRKAPHTVMWIDHREGRIVHLRGDELEAVTIMAPPVEHPPHQRGQRPDRENHDDTNRFFHHLTEALSQTVKVLIVGPSTAKLEFLRYLSKHDPALEQRVVGVETVDHPSEAQVVAYAKKFFSLVDRVLEPQARPWNGDEKHAT